MLDRQIGELIYRDYRVHSEKAALCRSGFLIVGCCDEERQGFGQYRQQGMSGAEMSKIKDPGRPDSVAEHSEGVLQLAISTSMWRPELIAYSELRRLTTLLLYHDAAETQLGDWADDGTRDNDRKDSEELRILFEMTEHWPRKQREELRSDFTKFQAKSTRLMQVAYCLDKSEAVLRMLEYERQGIIGRIDNKRPFSEQDRRFAEEIGSWRAADGWARHALELTKHYKGHVLVYWIMAAAFKDVRGGLADWMYEWGKRLPEEAGRHDEARDDHLNE